MFFTGDLYFCFRKRLHFPWVEVVNLGFIHVVFPSPVRWVPEVHPSSGDRAPEKRSPGTAVCPGWETQFTGGQASEPPTGKNRPYCPWRSTLPECVTPDWCLTDLSSATAWPSKPGPRFLKEVPISLEHGTVTVFGWNFKNTSHACIGGNCSGTPLWNWNYKTR